MTPPAPDARDPRALPDQSPRDARLDDTATFPAAPREAARGGPHDAAPDAARPLDADEARSVKATSAPVGALAGAAAGATAGLVTLTTGPVGFLIGAVAGALAGSLGGWFGGQAVTEIRYDEAEDAHYRALYEGGVPTDRGFDAVRPAYEVGHLAAHNPDWVGRDFAAVEPELRRAWDADLRTQHRAEWDAVRPYVRDAYGHARSEGAGVRRNAGVIGSAGTAVDPVELDRARGGRPSVDRESPGFVATRDRTTPATEPLLDPGTTERGAQRSAADGPALGELPETDANTAHRRDPEYH
jgi:hypothetical protein